ncbi:MAG: histidine triad nucleotide-binding protein [Syntrophaceae bacterium]|nr:histidine triad nucleotide-binding protein [Syntrophaceae bacterium]
MSDCVFCNIVSGKIPAKIVYEDEHVMAFHDANPASPIHILIVPKRHIPTLNDVPEGDTLLSHIGKVAKIIATKFGVADSGYRFFINVNKGGGQVIFHLHAHVVSGRDLGSQFIKLAIILATGWRKLVRKFNKKD